MSLKYEPASVPKHIYVKYYLLMFVKELDEIRFLELRHLPTRETVLY